MTCNEGGFRGVYRNETPHQIIMKHATRKDKRKRSWPAGLNQTKIKRLFRKRVRKGNADISNGNMYRKLNERWLINDFK